jgi:hypothetical protein
MLQQLATANGAQTRGLVGRGIYAYIGVCIGADASEPEHPTFSKPTSLECRKGIRNPTEKPP